MERRPRRDDPAAAPPPEKRAPGRAEPPPSRLEANAAPAALRRRTNPGARGESRRRTPEPVPPPPRLVRPAKPKGLAPPAAPLAHGVPLRWLKLCFGVFLLPFCWVLSSAFFNEFARAARDGGWWATEEFWFFALGLVLWLIAFAGLPRPLWIYVFGHEFTHALWVWLLGGRVSEFRVGSGGGYIVTDKNNFWIALAPYFFPLYAAILVLAWAAAGWIEPAAWEQRRWLFAGLGVTWGFHGTFAVWMIVKGQSDLTSQGTFFSLVVIYLINLALLAALLVAACPDVTWSDFGQRLLHDAWRFSAPVVNRLADWFDG